MNKIELSEYFFMGFAILCIILWLYCIFVACIKPFYEKYQKPRIENRNGNIYYYSIHFHCWRPFYIWSDVITTRTIKIHDTIRGLEFDYEYEGQGRVFVPYISQESIKYYCGQFKNNKEIDNNQIELINKEDDYLRQKIRI